MVQQLIPNLNYTFSTWNLNLLRIKNLAILL